MQDNSPSSNTVLITGGLGFIGSHAAIALIQSGFQPVIVDNLDNSTIDQLDKLQHITQQEIPFFKADVRDFEAIDPIFEQVKPHSVIHFAGLKSVPESQAKPNEYFDVNVTGFNKVIAACVKHKVDNIIFSSSATIYDEHQTMPTKEEGAIQPLNNYGWSKVFGERMLQSSCEAYGIKGVVLRYFNPVGCHPSGLIGERLDGEANNLLPHVLRAGLGLQTLSIFGNDYPTKDGTGERDYIHVIDLAEAHVQALNYAKESECSFDIFNVGLGNATSVKEFVGEFESVTGQNIHYEERERRPGDVAISYADCSKLRSMTKWSPQYSTTDMIQHAWNYAQNQRTESQKPKN